jgi:hypothetical protein
MRRNASPRRRKPQKEQQDVDVGPTAILKRDAGVRNFRPAIKPERKAPERRALFRLRISHAGDLYRNFS